VKCPKCNLEIDENVMMCPMCQTELLTSRDEDSEELENRSEAALLMTANDELQANIVESLLKVYGIPLRRKYKGNDTYGRIYMGLTIHGIDLYVPKEALEEAKGIIENELPQEAESDIPEKVESEEETQMLYEKYDRRRRVRAWIVLLFFAPGLIWLAILAIRWIASLLF